MRRFYSLFFLILILLNTIGYYEVLVIIDEQHHEQVVKKITEKEEEISGNLLLKISMSSPYGHDSEYQRVYGEVTVAGQVYHLVKQKVYHDTLYIVCLKDAQTTNVKNVIADYSKTFADQPQKSNTPCKTITSLAKFFTLGDAASSNGGTGWCLVLPLTHLQIFYSFSAVSSVFHPPSTIV